MLRTIRRNRVKYGEILSYNKFTGVWVLVRYSNEYEANVRS